MVSEIKKVKSKRKWSRFSYIILLAGVLISSYLVYNGIHGMERTKMCESRIAFTKSNIEKENARHEAIYKKEQYMKTDKFIEETARAKLGLVKNNEIIFEEN